MRNQIALVFISALLLGCTGDRPATETNHAHHNMNADHASSTSNATDHNAIGHGNAGEHSEMQSTPGAAAAPYDLQFLDTMIAHHQGALDMAMLAETRAETSALKELAAGIIYDQEKEIGKMSEWRDRWFGENAKAINMDFAGMSHGMAAMDLTKLKSLKGKEFDIEFLKQMIPHHEGAIEMAKDLQKQDSKPELKELARDIVTAQEAEIRQMREWQNQWGNVKK